MCAVCAVDVSVVDDALAHLSCTAEVLTIDPHTLDEVLGSIVTLGRATGRLASADSLVAEQRRRLDVVRRETAERLNHRGPRVMFLEWTDPPFAPGHWIPEMIEIAGGEPLLATPGEKSRRVAWEQVHAADPEIVIVAPCGFDRDGSQRLADDLVASGVLPTGVPVHAVDANASWARPGKGRRRRSSAILRTLTARSPA
jgi:iron complex transport system substrate-binding protein